MLRGDDLKTCRERKGLNQPEFAIWLNEKLGRRYDKQRVSKWEVGSEKIPSAVAELVSVELRQLTSVHGPAYILAVANQKGGVGKTTTAVNTATLLARRGNRVLLIDMDPQSNATMSLGIDPLQAEQEKRSLFNVFENGVHLSSIIQVVESSGLEVAPASPSLSLTEKKLASDSLAGLRLRKDLIELRREYDAIVIDCPPNLGVMTTNSLVAADSVLIPCQTEMLAVAGVGLVLKEIASLRELGNPGLRVIGILPTMYQKTLAQHTIALEAIQKQHARDHRIFSPIPRATAYGESVMSGTAAVERGRLSGIETLEEIADVITQERAKHLRETAHAA